MRNTHGGGKISRSPAPRYRQEMEPLVPPSGIVRDVSGFDPPEITSRRRIRRGLADTNMPSGDAGRLEGRDETPLRRAVRERGATMEGNRRASVEGRVRGVAGGEGGEEGGESGAEEGGESRAEEGYRGEVDGERNLAENKRRNGNEALICHSRRWIANQNINNNGNHDHNGTKEDKMTEDVGPRRQEREQQHTKVATLNPHPLQEPAARRYQAIINGHPRRASINDNNNSSPSCSPSTRDPRQRLLFPPPPFSNDKRGFESDLSDVASDGSSSYYEGPKTNKRAVVEKGKLLLTFSGRPRPSATRRSRLDAANLRTAEWRNRYLHGGDGTDYNDADAKAKAKGSRGNGKDAEERRSYTSSIITGGTVGQYDALEKSADWKDAGSPVRKRKDAASPTVRYRKDADYKKNAGDGIGVKAAAKEVNNANANSSSVKQASPPSESRRRGSNDDGNAAANQKSMMVAACLLFLWFLYTFVLAEKKPCISCIFGASSFDGGTPKF